MRYGVIFVRHGIYNYDGELQEVASSNLDSDNGKRFEALVAKYKTVLESRTHYSEIKVVLFDIPDKGGEITVLRNDIFQVELKQRLEINNKPETKTTKKKPTTAIMDNPTVAVAGEPFPIWFDNHVAGN